MIRTDQFLAMVDIVAAVGAHVALKRSGGGLLGLCPFHGEKTPSFRVDPKRQSYKCFGCGKGGDAISFYRELFGLGFLDACKKLAQDQGVSLEGVTATVTEEGRQRLRLAEAELPAFSVYMRARIEHYQREIEALQATLGLRREMAREIQKLAAGGEGCGLTPEQLEAFRACWFDQAELGLAIQAQIEALEKEIDRLELEPEAEVESFLRVFWVDRRLRDPLVALADAKAERDAAAEAARAEWEAALAAKEGDEGGRA